MNKVLGFFLFIILVYIFDAGVTYIWDTTNDFDFFTYRRLKVALLSVGIWVLINWLIKKPARTKEQPL